MTQLKELKYIVKSDGTRDMKQSGKIEDDKSDEQKAVELCNFLRIAFCVDEVLLTNRSSVFVLGEEKQHMLKGQVFEARDKVRGTFYISFTQ